MLPVQDQINEVLPLLREDGSFDDILREFEETGDEETFVAQVKERVRACRLSNRVCDAAQEVFAA
jgi:hypothetical protein